MSLSEIDNEDFLYMMMTMVLRLRVLRFDYITSIENLQLPPYALQLIKSTRHYDIRTRFGDCKN